MPETRHEQSEFRYTPEMAAFIAQIGARTLVSHESASAGIMASEDMLVTPEQRAGADALVDARMQTTWDAERQAIDNRMTEDRLAIFSDGVALLQPPKFLLDAYKVQDPHDLPRAVLSPTTNVGPRSAANFFEWHETALQKRREHFDRQEKGPLFARFKERLNGFINTGLIPAEAAKRLEALEPSGKLQVVITDTSWYEDAGGSTTHFSNGVERVELQLTSNAEDQEHAFTHELVHVLDGTTLVPGESAVSGVRARQDRGLWRLFGGGAGGTVIDEAVTEHTADALLHGSVERTLPNDPAREHNPIYLAPRFLLNVLCDYGVRPIHPRVFMHAMFETGELKDSTANAVLVKALDEAFPGMNVLERIKGMENDQPEYVVRFATNLFKEVTDLKAARVQKDVQQAANQRRFGFRRKRK